jgi:hypothetical protein
MQRPSLANSGGFLPSCLIDLAGQIDTHSPQATHLVESISTSRDTTAPADPAVVFSAIFLSIFKNKRQQRFSSCQ